MSMLKGFSAFMFDRATVRRILISLAALLVVLALKEASPIGKARLGLDVVFALAYAWVQSLMMSRLMAKAGVPAPWTKANLLPWLRTILDLAENALRFWLLESYPAIDPAIVAGTSVLTRAKWVVYYADLAILFSLGVATTGKAMNSRAKIAIEEA